MPEIETDQGMPIPVSIRALPGKYVLVVHGRASLHEGVVPLFVCGIYDSVQEARAAMDTEDNATIVGWSIRGENGKIFSENIDVGEGT